MINSLRRDSTTRKTVREDNLEHAQYHLVMFPKFRPIIILIMISETSRAVLKSNTQR